MAFPVPVIEFWALITRSSIMTSFKEQNYSKVIFSFRQIIEISWVWATLSLNMQICYYGATFSFKLSFRGNWKTFKASVLCHSISEVKISKELKKWMWKSSEPNQKSFNFIKLHWFQDIFFKNKVYFLPLIDSLSLSFLTYISLCWEFLPLINSMHRSLVISLMKPRTVLMTLLEQCVSF